MGEEIKKRVCALNGCDLKEFNITLGNRLYNIDVSDMVYIRVIDLIYRRGFSENDIICEACFSK